MEHSGVSSSWNCNVCLSTNSLGTSSCLTCKTERLPNPYSVRSVSLKDVDYVDCDCDPYKGARPKQPNISHELSEKFSKSSINPGVSKNYDTEIDNLSRWKCDKCSNLNVQSVQFCTSCGVRKEKEVILINDDDDYTVTYNHINTEQTTVLDTENKMASHVAMEIDLTEDWHCRRCTLKNPAEKTRCTMCESPREPRLPTLQDINEISTVDSGYMTSNRRGEGDGLDSDTFRDTSSKTDITQSKSGPEHVQARRTKSNSITGKEWTCVVCSFAKNPEKSEKCQMCRDGRKPTSKSKQFHGRAGSESPSPAVKLPALSSDKPSTNSSQNNDQSLENWTCVRCTMKNKAIAKSCAMCFAKKSKAAITGDSDWSCSVCTLKNPHGQLVCEACGKKRDDVAPSASSGQSKGDKSVISKSGQERIHFKSGTSKSVDLEINKNEKLRERNKGSNKSDGLDVINLEKYKIKNGIPSKDISLVPGPSTGAHAQGSGSKPVEKKGSSLDQLRKNISFDKEKKERSLEKDKKDKSSLEKKNKTSLEKDKKNKTPDKSKISLEKEQKWKCFACTFHNHANLVQCMMCGTMKGVEGSISLPSVGGLQKQHSTLMDDIRKVEENDALELWQHITLFCKQVITKPALYDTCTCSTKFQIHADKMVRHLKK